MPQNLKDALKYIMSKKGITQEALALDCGVDRKVIYNILYEEQPSLEHVVGICIALRIPGYVSEKVLRIAGYALRDTEAHWMYEFFLALGGQMSGSRCNDILKEKGLKLLFNGEQNT